VLITGGAGFIGSHLVDKLVADHEVVVLDDLSSGNIDNIQNHMNRPNFSFIRGSITDSKVTKKALGGVDTVYHFAAQADVRSGVADPMVDFRINIIGGITLLEEIRKEGVKKIVFASSGGTVYGDSRIFPTPENTPLAPISNYGAAKCAFEMYLSSYAELYGISAVSMRLANILGPRLTHGIIFDLYNKLKKDHNRLEVLGTGQQEKAYMYVTDTVEAATILATKMKGGHHPVNVSSGERLKVSRIAELVCAGLGVPEAMIEYTGSKRGWSGDVVVTDLEISHLKSFGWKPKTTLEEGVKHYLQWLIETYGSIK
jgi:UDP-glucose 4-epimerase